jgi:ABC-type sugar transport system ATPase subunit
MGDAVRRGLAYLPEDRKTDGLGLRLTVGENILAAVLPSLRRFGVYSGRRGAGTVRSLIETLDVQPPLPDAPLVSLSGGNQQKVLLAKWLAAEPRVLLLDEPTRGVDIGAKVAIHRAIDALAQRGHAILLISSDLPELVTLSDRVLVMRRGRIARELRGEGISEEAVLLAASGAEGSDRER